MGSRVFLALLVGVLTFAGAPIERGSPWATVAAPVFLHVHAEGLPHPDVSSIAQDPAGFIWIGTPGGLARYDGYEVRSFAPNPADPGALPDGWIRALAPDRHGGLWIGTESSGLVHYDAATERFRTWRAASQGTGGPRSTIVSALAQNASGAVWVGGDRGLDRFDPRADRFAHVVLNPRRPDLAVLSIAVDRERRLWVGTLEGLYVRPHGSPAFHRVALPIRQRGDVQIVSEFEDADGRLWIGARDAAFVIDRNANLVHTFRSSSTNTASLFEGEQDAIAQPNAGTIWIGSGDGGISAVDEATMRVRRIAANRDDPTGLPAGQVHAFLRGRSGLLWIAAGTGGLALYNPYSHGFFDASSSQTELGMGSDGAVTLAARGSHALWIGRLNGALTLLQPPHVRHAMLPNRSTPLDMSFAPNGTLWIGTLDGLCELAARASAPQCPAGPALAESSRVDAVLDDGTTLWVGTRHGLLAQNERTHGVRVYRSGSGSHALTDGWVTALLRDREGNLWIGTQDGLNRLDRSGTITQFAFDPHDPQSLSPGIVSSLLEDREGRLWAGSVGGQLNVLVPQPGGGMRIVHIGRNRGLPHDNVDGIAQDARGRIWVSTPRGIAMFPPGSLSARAFGPADGLSDQAFHLGSETAAGGVVFFGGFGGVTAIAPGASSPWTYDPPIVLSDLRVGHRLVPVSATNGESEPVTLQPGDRDVTVEFAALDYSAPRSLQYAYKLDGFDRDWIATDADHRIAAYTNLPPGDYTLHVRATNRLGVWTTHALALRIRALPAWFETWWFRLLVALAMIAGAQALSQIRTALLRQRQHELENLVESRTRELRAANRALEEMSLTDPLTGLRNRRFLTKNIDDEVTIALRQYRNWHAESGEAPPREADLLFFLVDLDHFKRVNDEFGHAAGDRVLVQIRGRLQGVLRDSDYLVRWGGEEFLAVARRTDRNDGEEIAERLRRAIGDHPFTLDDDTPVTITASIGFAAFPFDVANPQKLTWFNVVELSDEALYMAKRAGRNTWFGLRAGSRTTVRGTPVDVTSAASEDNAGNVGHL